MLSTKPPFAFNILRAPLHPFEALVFVVIAAGRSASLVVLRWRLGSQFTSSD